MQILFFVATVISGFFNLYVAQVKMNDLVNTNYWSHTNSNGCNYDCRIKGMPYVWMGEDLYKGTCNLAYAYKLWYASPTHAYVLRHPYKGEVILMQKMKNSNDCYIVLEKYD